VVTLGKAFPYPAVGTRLELCPLLMNSPSGVGYGASRAYKTAQRLQLQCSGSMHPPAQVTAFRVLWGHLRGFSLMVAYASRAEPGSVWGRSREHTPRLDVQAELCRGSRWALESRSMLSPLPVW
jgi:hypothetical protein